MFESGKMPMVKWLEEALGSVGVNAHVIGYVWRNCHTSGRMFPMHVSHLQDINSPAHNP